MHTALRALFDLAPGRRLAATAAALVTAHWSSEGFADDAQAAEYRARARGWVARYVEELDPHLDPVGVERWVSAPTQRIVVEGRVDRIDERDGELIVVDYKTGRRELTAEDARGSQALALYAFAARRTLRRQCRRVELHHLPTGTVAEWEHTEQALTRHLERAEQAAEEIALATEILATDTLATGVERDTLFPPAPSRACSWCEFRRHCPEGRASSTELQPWALLAP